jgi:hypothetical protein
MLTIAKNVSSRMYRKKNHVVYAQYIFCDLTVFEKLNNNKYWEELID